MVMFILYIFYILVYTGMYCKVYSMLAADRLVDCASYAYCVNYGAISTASKQAEQQERTISRSLSLWGLLISSFFS
jgi:hypothetical protein